MTVFLSWWWSMRVDISQADMNKVRDMLSDIRGGADLALSRSINKGVSTGRTQAVRSIGGYLNLTATRIRRDFEYSYNSTRRNLTAGIIAKGQPVGLINFGANARRGGYSVKVLRSGARTFLKHSFKATFRKTSANGTWETEHLVWRMNFGGTRKPEVTAYGYFASLPRKHFKKAPLDRLEGPRIEDVFAKQDIYDHVLGLTNNRVIESIDVEIETILRRHRG